MGRGVGRHRGGIASLVELLSEHGEAIEFDLLSMGLRLSDLGSRLLTWRDLRVIVGNLSRGSALSRAINGDGDHWGIAEHLLASIADTLSLLGWAAGLFRGPKPRPYQRPGVDDGSSSFGSGAIPISDFDAWWDSGAS